MKAAAASLATLMLGGCAHFSAPAGWDCRAAIARDGIRANAWQHLTPQGGVQHTRAEWWAEPTNPAIPRFGAVWESSGQRALDWPSGRVELIYAGAGLDPGESHRLEIHGNGRPLLVGAFSRGPSLLLSASHVQFRNAAASAAPHVVIISQSGREVLRRALRLSLVEHGQKAAAEALALVMTKNRDHARQCERAPKIILT